MTQPEPAKPQGWGAPRERISHAMWCAYQMGAGLPFNEEPTKAQLQSQHDGFVAFDTNPAMTPEENHDNWVRFKVSHGWTFGPVRDEELKQHPDLIPYAELPEVERMKDEMDLFSRRFATALAGIAHPEKLGELLEVCQRLVQNEGRVAFRDQCAWFDDVKAALAAIGTLPAEDAP